MKCELCGEPMPAGETMFKYHGYSGPCPKPPLKRPRLFKLELTREELDLLKVGLTTLVMASDEKHDQETNKQCHADVKALLPKLIEAHKDDTA